MASQQIINEQTIKQISQGSERAFAHFYDAYFVYLNTIAIYYICDEEASKEIVNDVFLSLWNKRGELSYPIHRYLVQSVKNRCINYLRDKRTEIQLINKDLSSLLEFQEERICNHVTPLTYLESKEIEDRIMECMNQLSPKCHDIFEAYFLKGMTSLEIANAYSIAQPTVRVHLKNATDHLKEKLKDVLSVIPII